MIDSYDVLFDIVLVLMFVFVIVGVIHSINNNENYYYECVTLDNETITCESITESKAGITGTRDGTTYLIKQFTRKEKKKDE